MNLFDIILIAIGLAMDCFAVSVTHGLAADSNSKPFRHYGPWLMALMFGLFQGGMPLIGYFAGTLFANFFSRFAPWIALILLAFIGGKMIYESFHGNIVLCKLNNQRCSKRNAQCTHSHDKSDCPHCIRETQEQPCADFSLKHIVALAVATSIDALATGVIFIPVPDVLWLGVGIIALVSFLFSIIGFTIGELVGNKFHFNVGLLGGIILIAIGLKIFIEGVFLNA